MDNRCYTLIPSHEIRFRDKDTYHGCLKPYAHNDSHLHILLDGKFLEWESDYKCGCDPDDDDCQCFIWSYIEPKTALAILKKIYNGSIPHEIEEVLRKHKILP